MQPKITIIIPVYNVEHYLRQCLDSVVNQTLRDIEIICVNDGSTDGSLAILNEYAKNDNRLTILDQKNQGGGGARNDAIHLVKGKYTLFADSDDWLNLELCEKVYRKAEETDADMVYFRMKGTELDTHSPKFDPKLPPVRTTPEERTDLLLYFTATWNKIYRSQMLISENIRFSQGKRAYNDILPSWKGCVHARRIAIIDEMLYHRRIRPGSYQQILDASHYSIIDTTKEVETMLRESNLYSTYRNTYISMKLSALRRTYLRLPYKYGKPFKQMILDTLSDEDRDFLQSPISYPGLSRKVRLFYKMLENQTLLGRVNLHLLETASMFGRWSRSTCLAPAKHIASGIWFGSQSK